MWLIEASWILSPLPFTSAVSFTSVSSQGMSSVSLIFLYLFDFFGGDVLGFSVEEVCPIVVQAPSSQFCASVSVRGGLDPCSYCLSKALPTFMNCAPQHFVILL